MEFVFINVKEPKDALRLAKEPEIRSHVARHQWKQAENRPSTTRSQKNAYPPICVDMGVCSRSDPNADPNDMEDRSSTISIPPQLGGLRVDPFWSYPIEIKPFIPLLVDHYLAHMAVEIPELDQPGNKGLLRTTWFPLVMTDRALFLITMLLAASNYASVHNKSAMKLHLLSFQCDAIQAINTALKYQQPSYINDALIAAIAKMGSYEAIYGNIDNYNVHMNALTRAIALRGGLSRLGLDGLLRRIIVWIDRNAAFLHGSPLHFPGATLVPGQPLPDPNPGHFLGVS
ncbi:hypothetical protein BDV23DRAFT_40371 [Aspergillus alliaceus]|uniref:Transcription factor domain-containing protein n=1 Tax=Petromyces alliaceus TaxID=209559 RepID=A0A5N7BR00_PETAA|nr:hypothetical protein BDV23DRAFT_40371 [Aspergillus alliaceus]